MSPLALNSSFSFKSAFYTDSVIFNYFKIKEDVISFLDKIFALILIVTLMPLMSVICLLIRITMGKGVFYSQIRVGKDEKCFPIYKFRTMSLNAEADSGPILSKANDPRVTRLGKILRASHLDELPQLFNVLRNEMSFIGPRPERPEFVKVFSSQISGYKNRHRVRPGITGLAQICLPYSATPQEKLVFDEFYIKNRHSLLLNIIISHYTALKMIAAFNLVKQIKVI